MTTQRSLQPKIAAGIAALVVVGGLGYAWSAAAGSSAETDNSVETPSLSTATIVRQDLTESVSWDATLDYSDAVTITNHVDSGTVTWIAPSGSNVANGEALYRVDDGPVVLLVGDGVLWRDLASGSDGADVQAVEAALVSLGFDPEGTVTVDTDYTSNTAAMVQRFQEVHGLEETGELQRGSIHMAASPLRIGEQVAQVGDPASAGLDIFESTTTSRVATISVEPSTRGDISIGDTIEIRLPDRSTVPASVSSISSTVDPDTGSYVALASVSDAGGYVSDQLVVTAIGTTIVAKDALVVSPDAILRSEGGQYQLAMVTNDVTTIVPIEVLGKAGRSVAVSGDGLADGTIVMVP